MNMNMSITRLRTLAAADAGETLVELALALPLLVTILAITVDYARIFHTSVALQNAARAGAQYGSQSVGRSGETSNMQTTATGAVDVSGVSATASRSCQCATDAGVFSDTSPTPNNCAAPASVSCPSKHLVATVTVTTTKTFNSFMHLPGLPASVNLTRSATLRVPDR